MFPVLEEASQHCVSLITRLFESRLSQDGMLDMIKKQAVYI